MPPPNKTWCWRRFCLGTTRRTLNLLLLGLAVTQLAVAWALHMQVAIPLPVTVQEAVREALHEQGIEGSWASLRFRAPGWIEIRRPRLVSLERPDLEAEAGSVIVELKRIALFQGKVVPRRVLLANGQLWWQHERVAQRLDLTIDLRGAPYLERAQGLVLGTPVLASGTLPTALPLISGDSDEEPELPPLGFAWEIAEWLRQQEGVFAHARISPAALQAAVFAPQLQLPRKLRAQDIHLEVRVKQADRFQVEHLQGHIRRLTRDRYTAHQTHVWASVDDPEMAYPAAVSLSASMVEGLPLTLECAQAEVLLDTVPLTLPVAGSLRVGGQPQAFRGQLLATGAGGLEADLQVTPAMVEALLPDLEGLLTGSHPVEAQLRAVWNRQRELQRVEGRFRGESLRIHESDFPWFRGHLRYVDDLLEFPNIQATNPGGWATGYYSQNLSTNDWVLLAKGQTYPDAITSLLPSFYERLMQVISAPEKPVRADVSVTGQWGNVDLTRTFLTATGEGLHYKGQRTDQVDLRLWQSLGHVTIPEITVVVGEGTFEGTLGWVYPAEPDGLTYTLLDIQSHLPLPLLAVALGEEVRQVGDVIRFEAAPRVHLRGWLAEDVQAQAVDRRIDVEAQSDQPLHYKKLTFDRLHGKARLLQDRAEDVSLDGQLWGGAFLLNGESGTVAPAPFRLQANLIGGLGKPLLSFIETQMGAQPWEGGGVLDVNAELSGEWADWHTWQGSGSLNINEADLATIDLFGGLSRAFKEAGLGLGSFELTHADATLRLDRARLDVQSLNLRGEALSIAATGVVLPDENDLELNAKLSWTSTGPSPLGEIANLFFWPLSQALEVQVTGPLDEPTWRFRNNPLNLFRRKEAVAAPTEVPAEAPAD